MSIEVWSAVAQIGTFVVIALTAIAALVQLQHLRSANQLTAWQTFFQTYEGAELADAFHFVRAELAERLKDPLFRAELRDGAVDRARHPEIKIANFFDQWGSYYRMGAIDRRAYMIASADMIVSFWRRLEPVVALLAVQSNGVNTSFESFEYLAVQAKEWLASHPGGNYPAGVARMPLADKWAEIDNPKP
jgi:hypothetical protein